MVEVILATLLSVGVTGVAIAVGHRCADACNHSYERIDTCNDKRVILVCSKCGKIKKWRK